MAKVEIYTTKLCPYCKDAKDLLDSKGVTYDEHKVDGNAVARSEMTVRAKGATAVPQIFIDNNYIGGCDDLYALEEQGKLDGLLNNGGNGKGGSGPT